MLNYLFLIFMLIGTVFVDLPLQIFIGTIGKSLMVFIAPSIALILYMYSNKFRKILFRSDVKLYYTYYILTYVTSLFFLLFYMFINGKTISVYGDNILYKLLRASTYVLIFALVYHIFVYLFQEIPNIKLKNIFLTTFILLTVIGILEAYNKELFYIYHPNKVEYSRLRLFTSEPSQAALLYTVFALVATISIRKKIKKILCIILFFIIFYFMVSKGALVAIVVSLFISYFLGLNLNYKIKTAIIIIPITCIVGYIFIKLFINSLMIDIKYFTSFSTRFTSFISALVVLIYYPIGVGYGTYLEYYQSIIEKAKSVVCILSPFPLNFSELDNMILTGRNIGLKSGITSQILFNGWIAVLFFLILFIKTYNRISNIEIKIFDKFLLKALILFIFIEITFFVDIEVMYAYLIPIALVNNLYNTSHKGTKI